MSEGDNKTSKKEITELIKSVENIQKELIPVT